MHSEQIQNAAVEVLTQIAATSQPASEILNAYTRARRYIGSKDRRALNDMVWGVLRHRARLLFAHPDADERLLLTAYLQNDFDRPDAPDDVKWEVPAWLIPHILDAQTELPALLESAPIVLRANGDRAQIQKELAAEGLETIQTPLSPYGLILTKRVNLNAVKSYQNGRVEVQDEGSQLVALETGIRPGDRVLDYCAGAGGKSLIFAQMMHGNGQIVAHDISVRSLKELEKRAERAKAHIIQTVHTLRPGAYPQGFTHVVVDAPCSGTGTWRRAPDARWRLTPEHLKNLVEKQRHILEQAQTFVGDGGYLSYMTCSLTHDENEDQVRTFLHNHPEFSLERTKQVSPAKTGTDGLFVAVFRRK